MTQNLTQIPNKSFMVQKTSPNKKLTLFLRTRDYFVDEGSIDGAVNVDTMYLNDRKVFAQLIAHYRFGRECDETMGLKFYRDFILDTKQIYPPQLIDENITDFQWSLKKKFPKDCVCPFEFRFPKAAPISVTIYSKNDNNHSEACGVQYLLKAFMVELESDIPRKKSTVGLNIRRVQHAPRTMVMDEPSYRIIEQNFIVCSGSIELETTLDKSVYKYDEKIPVNIGIRNNSDKTVRKIRVTLMQNVSIKMLQNGSYKRVIDEHVSKKNCPLCPGSNLQTIIFVTPKLTETHMKDGLALDGHYKCEERKLASSTFLHQKSIQDAFGIIVRYFIRVKLHFGKFDRYVSTDLPFYLASVRSFDEMSEERVQEKNKENFHGEPLLQLE